MSEDENKTVIISQKRHQIDDIKLWLKKEKLSYKYSPLKNDVPGTEFIFKTKEGAVMFKLRWGDGK